MRFLPLALLCAAISFAHAQSQGVADSVVHVREVVVRGASEIGEAIPSVRLDERRLQGLGSSSVADALRYFGGLQIKDYGGVGGIKTVNIRSMGSAHLGVFYDGVEMGNAQNGQVDLGQLSLDNVEAISLYNGQKSAILQSATDMGRAGTVYIQTKRPTFGLKPYRLRAKLRHASSGEVWAMAAAYDRRLSRRVSASVTAEGLTATGKYKFRYKRNNADGTTAYDTTATRQNGDMWALRAEANLYGTMEGGLWTLKAYSYNSERGIPGAIVNNVWRRGERQWDHNTFVQGTVRKSITPWIDTKLTAKYAYYNTRYVNNDTTTMLLDNRYRQQELYVSAANALRMGRGWHVSASYDFRWNRLDADLHNFVYPRRMEHLLAVAVAACGKWVRSQASLVATFVKDHTERQTEKPAERRLTPAVYVGWAPLRSELLWLRAFAKRSFRMPTFNELYYTDVGNAALQPEMATQYDVGMVLQKQFGKAMVSALRLQADTYLNMVTNKIIAYPRGQQFRWTMLNLGRVKIVGVDVLAEAAVKPAKEVELSCRLQYTYQQARDRTNRRDSYWNDQIPYIPLHSGSVAMTLAWGPWRMNYGFLYTGERYGQQENIAANHLQPWYTHDINMTYDMERGGADLRLALAINNLLSQDYDVIVNYPMPKRNYTITLSISL